MANLIEIIFRGKNEVGPAVEDVKESLGGVQDAAKRTSGAFDTAMGVLAAEQVQQFGQALTGFMTSSIEEAMAAEDNMAQLEAVIKSTGGAAGITAQAAADLAGSLSEVTRFEDDAILGAENMLLTFTNIGKDAFPGATEAALNMSQALGQDLQSSAMQIGKALNDPVKGVTALQRVGVTFTDAQKDMIKALMDSGDTLGAQMLILQELQKEFGGSAEAAGKTFAGSLDRLNNAWGNMKETVGTALTQNKDFQGLLDKLITLVNGLADAFTNLPEGAQTAIIGFLGLGALLAKLAPALISMKVLFGGFGGAAAGTKGATAAAAGGLGLFGGAVVTLGGILQGVGINAIAKYSAKLGKEFGEMIGVKLPGELGKLQDMIITKGPFSAATWAQAGAALQQGLAGIGQAFSSLGPSISVSFQQIIADAGAFFTDLMNHATVGFMNVLMSASTAATQLVTLWKVGWATLLLDASTSAQQLITIVTTAGNNLITSISGWISRATTAAMSVGRGIVTGIWNGIQSGWAWLKDSIAGSMDSLLAWVKSTLGIASPSKVFAESVGIPIAQGIGQGFQRGMGAVGPAMGAALQPSPVMAGGGYRGATNVTINGRFYSPLTRNERQLINQGMRKTGEDLLLEVLK